MNTPSYEVTLRLRRWITYADTNGTDQMRRDLRAVERAILAQSEEIRVLKISRSRLVRGDAPVKSCMVDGTPEEQAQAICAADGPVDVYRYPRGTITFRKRGSRAAKGAEFIGTYDDGCDYRDVVADLSPAYPLLAELRRVA